MIRDQPRGLRGRLQGFIWLSSNLFHSVSKSLTRLLGELVQAGLTVIRDRPRGSGAARILGAGAEARPSQDPAALQPPPDPPPHPMYEPAASLSHVAYIACHIHHPASPVMPVTSTQTSARCAQLWTAVWMTEAPCRLPHSPETYI